MGDTAQRSKKAFWALALGVLVLAGVPSLVLLEAARDYWRFLRGWDPAVLRPTTVRRIPHRDEGELPDIRFVEFVLKTPAAHAVGLAASFNGFDPAALKLTREEDGTWRTVVPLPPGSYEYAFEVDGRWTPDPAAGAPNRRGAREMSLKVVE